ncbi:MAG: filamentous hemagglutinin transporter protein FhaC [Rubrivivax sp.]
MTARTITTGRLAWALLGAAALGLPVQAQTEATATERRVDVQGFAITGVTLLDAAVVQAALERFKGRRTLAELREATTALQTLYVQAGYGAVVAYLPSQAIEDGTIAITVLEGKVGAVVVQGQRRKTAAQIRAALPTLREGETPRVRRIDGELQMANENPGRTVGVLLGPGAKPGEVQATVKVQEGRVQRWQLGLDNSGNRRTGEYRLSAGWQHTDLSGRDDVLTAQLQTSPTEADAVAVTSLGYRIPFPHWLAALDLYAAYNDVDGGTSATAAGDLSFSGRGRIVGARWTAYRPRLGEFDQRLVVGLEQRAYLNQCAITGLPPGACGPAGESVTVQPFTVEWALQRGGEVSAAVHVGLTVNLGLGGHHGGAADFEAVRAGAKRRYTVLRAGGYLALPVLEDWTLALRGNLQFAADPLVPGEQFGIGGSATVRGYEEREITGDSGLVAGVELIGPRWQGSFGAQKVDLQLLGFVEAGQARNQDDAACSGTRLRCSLASFGIGARLGAGPVQTRLSVAQAAEDGAVTKRGDWRTHFSMSASF